MLEQRSPLREKRKGKRILRDDVPLCSDVSSDWSNGTERAVSRGGRDDQAALCLPSDDLDCPDEKQ